MKYYSLDSLQTFGEVKEEWPREKLINRGVSALSDTELAAILIGSGLKDSKLPKISRDLIKLLDGIKNPVGISELLTIRGIGPAKACVIAAGMEFTRRRLCPVTGKIIFPTDLLPALQYIADRPQESFITVSLNGAHEVITRRIVSTGLVNRTLVHPREVFADSITDRAAAVIVAHNHPSGEVAPSGEDREITKRLCEAGRILGIPVLDHIIFSKNKYYSFAENGAI